MLKQDNSKMYEEFIKEKEIIDVDDIISKIQHVDIDSHHDENGFLKELPADKPFLAVISPLGSGKTYQIKKLIEKHGITKKILLVVGRCSLGCEFTYKVFKDLGFEYYKDKTDFKNCQRLVIQVDSLFKLYTNGSDHLDNIFDWLIVDECELIADRLCEINKNKHECMFYFNWCLKYCKKVILSDGQLSQNVIDVFSDVRQRQPFIIRNSFNRNTNIKHTVFHELKNPINMPIFDYVLQEAISDIKNGKNLYIVCNEKTNALALKKSFSKFTDNVYCFTGDTPDPEKRYLCMNLNENAAKYSVFITTSVLLAGNSIDTPHFDKCYVFVADKTDNPRSIHQMIKRVRNLRGNEIVSHITYSEHMDHKYDMIDIRRWMMSTERYMNEPNNWFNCFDYDEHGILEHKRNMYYDLFCRYKHQQMNRRCFLSWYVGLCCENKYNVIVQNETPAKNVTCEVDHKENKQIVKLEHNENIACVDLPTEEEYEKLKQCTYNNEEQYKKEKFIFAANYHLIDKPEAHDETINNIKFVSMYFPHKKRKRFKFLLNIAYTSDTFDIFLECINTKTKNRITDKRQ